MYLEEAALERQLPELDLRMLVDLPPGLDYNEWLASHTLALFDHINLVYGTISEFCTMTGCPDMTGPGLRYVSPLARGVPNSERSFQGSEAADRFVTIDLLFQNVSVVRRKGKENEGCGATIYRLRYDIYATHR